MGTVSELADIGLRYYQQQYALSDFKEPETRIEDAIAGAESWNGITQSPWSWAVGILVGVFIYRWYFK